MLSLFGDQHAYLATADEKGLLEQYLFPAPPSGREPKVTPAAVGKSPAWIAKQAGFAVPDGTSIILAEAAHVGPQEPLSREKLCPDMEGLMQAAFYGTEKAAARVD